MSSETHLGATATGQIMTVPLECITVTYNVRNVLPNLPEPHTYISMLRMAQGCPEDRAEFIRILTEHEEAIALVNPKRHTILELAASIYDQKQAEPIIVRQLGTSDRRTLDTNEKTGEKKYGYALVVGGRRTMAIAYLHAQGLGKPYVEAVQKKLTKEQALDLSIAENFHRQDFSDREIGDIVAALRHPTEGGEPATWDEITKRLRRSEQTLRFCYYLVRPDVDAPPDVLKRLEAGEITKGEAVRLSKPKKSQSGPQNLGDGQDRLFKPPVRKALAVKSIESLMDGTPDDTNEVNVARITAFAEALGSTYDVEIVSSRARRAKNAASPDIEAA